MGLDIYHFRVQDEVVGHPITINSAQPEIAKILSFAKKKTNQYVDFERLFSDHGLSQQDYRLVFRNREMWGIGKFADNYYFCAANEADPMNPQGTGLYFTNKRSFFPQKPNLPPNAAKKVKKIKLREYPQQDRLDDVVYTEQVGYQRNSVAEPFFRIFPPDWMFAERIYAEKILELTVPEAQDGFRTNFLNNWADGRSLVVVSY